VCHSESIVAIFAECCFDPSHLQALLACISAIKVDMGLFIINNSINSFGGHQGQDCLTRNARSISSHIECSINNIDNARTGGQIAFLGLISQGAMLV
jgi:hypothetical protein